MSSYAMCKRDLFRLLGHCPDNAPIYVRDGKKLRPLIAVHPEDWKKVELWTGKKEAP